MADAPEIIPSDSPVQLLVLFRMEGQDYALPLERVERVVPAVAVSPLPQAPAVALGIINLHGRVVPVLDIRSRFGLPPRQRSLGEHLLIAHSAQRMVAFPVDEVTEVKDVATGQITPPGMVLPGIAHLLGVATQPDGLILIHDLDAFLSLDEEAQLACALQGGTA